MTILKEMLPVIILTGLILLCPVQNAFAVDIDVRRFGSGGELDNDDSPSISDSTNFGSTTQISLNRRFQFRPTGRGTLVIQSVTVSGTNASEFSVQGFPSSINSSWNTFVIRFTPTSAGTKNARVIIRSNAEDDPEFIINVRATADVCLPGNTIETATGLHVSSRVTTTADGWTCYCNSSGNLLMALNIAGTGAVIPSNGVELNIGTRRAQYFNHGSGFVGNIVGFTGITKTWAINPTTQPSTPVRVRIFFTQADTTALSDTMRRYSRTRLGRLSNIIIYNVTNNARSRHSTVATLRQNDIAVYDNGTGSANWRETALPGNLFSAELRISNLNTLGLGASPGGITPLPVSFVRQTAVTTTEGVRIDWQVVTEEQGAKFIIERSSDGRQYSRIGTVYSLPTAVNGQVVSYTFTDAAPLKGIEWATYRITAVAENGEQRQAPVMKVKMNSSAGAYRIFKPENAISWKVMMPAEATQGNIAMFNMNGVQVKQWSYAAGENGRELDLNTSLLPAGIYIVKISDQTAGLFTTRIINGERP